MKLADIIYGVEQASEPFYSFAPASLTPIERAGNHHVRFRRRHVAWLYEGEPLTDRWGRNLFEECPDFSKLSTAIVVDEDFQRPFSTLRLQPWTAEHENELQDAVAVELERFRCEWQRDNEPREGRLSIRWVGRLRQADLEDLQAELSEAVERRLIAAGRPYQLNAVEATESHLWPRLGWDELALQVR